MQTEEATAVYDEIPDTKLLTKSMEHYLKETILKILLLILTFCN